MTDQELLNYAAKAVGITFDDDLKVWVGDCRFDWNPLTNDADAFELMVKLHMNVRHMSWLSRDAWKIQVGVCMDFLTEEKCGNDPLQAARRAITEMAEEIGRGM